MILNNLKMKTNTKKYIDKYIIQGYNVITK